MKRQLSLTGHEVGSSGVIVVEAPTAHGCTEFFNSWMKRFGFRNEPFLVTLDKD